MKREVDQLSPAKATHRSQYILLVKTFQTEITPGKDPPYAEFLRAVRVILPLLGPSIPV